MPPMETAEKQVAEKHPVKRYLVGPSRSVKDTSADTLDAFPFVQP